MKKILFSLMTIAAVLGLAGTGTLAYFTDTETSVGNIFTAGVWEEPTIGVKIDIRPGVYPNVIVLCDDCYGYIEYIPVAILTTPDFDASTVDGETVDFGPDEAYPEHWALEDVDGDGDLDMLLYFETEDTGIEFGDTRAELEGETLAERDIYGSDSVVTVPPCDCDDEDDDCDDDDDDCDDDDGGDYDEDDHDDDQAKHDTP